LNRIAKIARYQETEMGLQALIVTTTKSAHGGSDFSGFCRYVLAKLDVA
jgi:hypothetical protein